ncbi:kinesin-domain-containing protein [Rickenella mellea]|uniref:Kinesin-domain-containing protein n=1 Tax=Rickenella mellea TaxID=50990 RepID=A0A4R5XEA7_9AGAM|nr:kinesin-domain-containing protein [Rickenella mellea]
MVSAGSITVAVRVRPPNVWESARLPEPCFDTGLRGDGALATPGRAGASPTGLREVVKIIDDRVLMFDPDEKDRTRAFLERGFVPPGTKRYKDKRFIFDRVFDSDTKQVDVYEGTTRPLLDGLLDGYNATVFAYGATGCGKTHTISGTDKDPGIIYLTMADLFRRIEERRDEHNIDISVTFLEIYNEEIRDLLTEPGSNVPRGGLQIREDKTVKVAGLVELHPNSAEQIKEIVLLGNTRRTQSATHANETSSRSHAVLQIHVTQSPRTASTTEQRSLATLSIIDLAGSERAAATTNMGQRMVEGANINKSLLALGNCINALCESGGATRHVPYRNSKLTRLLKFSLGGNCKTVMIVCIAPTSNHFDDTHNTLLYADRASKIKTKVVTRNVVNVDRHVGQYVEAIQRLNMEVAELKAKLAGKLKAESDVAQRKKDEARSEVERAKSDLKRKYEQTQPSILDGANCDGKLGIAQAKLAAIRDRLSELKSQAATAGGSLSAALVAEQELLQAMAAPEEALIASQSGLSTRLQRSKNSRSMFDATLRAVTERRSSGLDDISIENIHLDAKCRKLELDKARAEAERDVLKESVTTQTALVTNLVGMLARCTVMMEEGSKMLRGALEEGRDGLDGTVRALSASLHGISEANNTSFSELLGRSIASHVTANSSSLLSFSGHAISNAPVINVLAPTSPAHAHTRGSRRMSSLSVTAASPGRRSYRSPRKSLRSSLVPGSLPMMARRVVSEKISEKKKGVQWKDEAGKGDLDDGMSAPIPVIVDESSPSRRCNTPMGGSESEWEDEKTEESVNFSLVGSSSRDNLPTKPGPRRPRASRLDPSFLKSRGPKLSSLAEDDETCKQMELPRRNNPLSDCANHLQPDRLSNALHIPKGRARDGSPPRRPSTLRVPGSAAKNGRRRSNIGPMRSEKTRRRSSLLPQPSPSDSDGPPKSAARRVPISHSPARRVKRASLLGAPRPSGTLRSSILKSSTLMPPIDPNGSGDLSFRGSKPTWR